MVVERSGGLNREESRSGAASCFGSNYCSLLYPYGNINKPAHSQHVLFSDR